jgi:hypothetical protein
MKYFIIETKSIKFKKLYYDPLQPAFYFLKSNHDLISKYTFIHFSNRKS